MLSKIIKLSFIACIIISKVECVSVSADVDNAVFDRDQNYLFDYHVDYNEIYDLALEGKCDPLNLDFAFKTSAYMINSETNERIDARVYSSVRLIDDTIYGDVRESIYLAANIAKVDWDYSQGENDWDQTGGISHTSYVYFSIISDSLGVEYIKLIYMTGFYMNYDYPQVIISNRTQRFYQSGFAMSNFYVSNATNWSSCSNNYTRYAPSNWPYISYLGYYDIGSDHMATLTHFSGSSWNFYSNNGLFNIDW